MAISDSPRGGVGACSPRLDILSRLPARPRLASPILFVHGAWHGAWCWEDHFLDYFADLGFTCYAVNLRGHGASGGTRDVRFCRIRHYVEDLEEAVNLIGAQPILVGHSLGGFLVQKYLEKHRAQLGVLLASVPPNGGLRMVKRIMRLQPLDMLHANLAFSLRPLFSNAKKVRRSLFSDSTPESIVAACARRLQDDVIVGLLDYLFLDLVDASRVSTPMLVFGALDDCLIDSVDLEVTGRAYGQAPVVIPDVGHDMMIDHRWKMVAEAVASGIDRHFRVGSQDRPRAARVA